MQIYADSFLSACVLFFFLNLWSFKTAGGQTASCLKFMKDLFNSAGRDLSWQPFTSPSQAPVWHLSGPYWTWCMFHDRLLCCIIHIALSGSALIRGISISVTCIMQTSFQTLLICMMDKFLHLNNTYTTAEKNKHRDACTHTSTNHRDIYDYPSDPGISL